jgi:hypothetical protein
LVGVPNAGFIPVGDDFADYNYNNYTSLYVQYPSSRYGFSILEIAFFQRAPFRDYTALSVDEPLSAEEEDYVAFKLNLPQNSQPTSLSLNVRVDFKHNGVNKVNYHTVAVPVVAFSGIFNPQFSSPIGPLRVCALHSLTSKGLSCLFFRLDKHNGSTLISKLMLV